jgi:hypothetical protein
MVDIYSKSVFTVIAGALVVIAVQNAIRPSSAQVEYQKVRICDTTDCATLTPVTRFGMTQYVLPVAQMER